MHQSARQAHGVSVRAWTVIGCALVRHEPGMRTPQKNGQVFRTPEQPHHVRVFSNALYAHHRLGCFYHGYDVQTFQFLRNVRVYLGHHHQGIRGGAYHLHVFLKSWIIGAAHPDNHARWVQRCLGNVVACHVALRIARAVL